MTRNYTVVSVAKEDAVEKRTPLDHHVNSHKWIGFATLGIGLLVAYFLIVYLFGDTILGFYVGARYLGCIVVVSFSGIYWLLRWTFRWQLISIGCLKNVGVLSSVTLLSIIAADVGYSVYFNATMPPDHDYYFHKSYRVTDKQLWFDELYPHTYYPTERNFVLHKPYQKSSGEVYGWAYYSALKDSPTVVESVLERRHVSFVIDEHGFRETTPLRKAHVFALGDSFTFSTLVSQEKTWVKLLERAIERPIYNLGINGTSPKQQLMILEYMLHTKGDSLKIRHLLWMIFEGNDLEESYQTARSVKIKERNVSRGTIVDAMRSMVGQVRSQAIIHKLSEGEITFGLPFGNSNGKDPYVVDGMRVIRPVYHSDRCGYRIFLPEYIERASTPQSYVLEHPNRPLLDQTFREMGSLSDRHGFKVTVLIAPSAPRLYGRYFEDFPAISEEPYFINYVEKLSQRIGFEVINLYELMQPYARKELLYWRDDTHWNERGNQVVASIIAKHFAGSQFGVHADSFHRFKDR